MTDNFKYYLERYLPAVFLILLFSFFLYFRFIEGKKVFKKALLSEQRQQDSIFFADSLKRIEFETKGVEEHQDSVVMSDKEELPVSVGEIRGTYYIIVGSFTNPENAKLMARKYRSLGYKTSIISATMRNGIKAELVSVNTLNNFNEAVRYLREFQNKFDSKTWIYSNQ
ncbi:MAG TPA: SPOR domain-containing protein [Ignavibacteria bacterium]